MNKEGRWMLKKNPQGKNGVVSYPTELARLPDLVKTGYGVVLGRNEF